MDYRTRRYTNYHENNRFLEYNRKKINNEIKKPRHTTESRREATRRERLRVKALAQAYLSLQRIIPFDSGTKITYLTVLKGAVAYIKALEMILGIRKDIFNRRKKEMSSLEHEENTENVIKEMKVKEEPV